MQLRKPGRSSRTRARSKGTKIICPRCGAKFALKIEYPNAPKGSEEVECQKCHATLDVKYICTIEVDDVKVLDTPIPEVECPVCDTTLILDDVEIDSETGSTDLECPDDVEECGAELKILWSDWGRETEVEVRSEPEKEEQEKKQRRREAVKGPLQGEAGKEAEDEDEDEGEDNDEDDYYDEDSDDDAGDRQDEEEVDDDEGC